MNKNNLAPTYYVRHPDDSYSVAAPQPSIPAQQQASTAQEQAASVPAGWKLVPVEPTQDMKDATNLKIGGCYSCSASIPSWAECAEIYADMLAAAPPPPVAPAHAHSERSEETLTDAEIEAVVTPLFQNRACQKHDYIVARAIAAHLARKG